MACNFNEVNPAPPMIMHIDLNSCFASVAQQANPLLRGKPLVVAAYTTPRGCILSASIEAKRLGIKGGMRVEEAQAIFPKVVVRMPDTVLIRDIHSKFNAILQDYSPDITKKSIDESVVDFGESEFKSSDLESVAKEIKERLASQVGEWIRCSIGIGTNRFLAKTAASFQKPDGLIIITPKNLLSIYAQMHLVDLHGINVRYEKRLHANGITTPLEFFHAPADFLAKHVFESVQGTYWHQQMRGWETPFYGTEQKTYGQQYALGEPTQDSAKLLQLLMKLCEKMGRRLRKAQKVAFGIHVACAYTDRTYWHIGRKQRSACYATSELFQRAKELLYLQPQSKRVGKLSVCCYSLAPLSSQISPLFQIAEDRWHEKAMVLAKVSDRINDKYGEFTLTPALMGNMDDLILDRIAFGTINRLL